MSTWVFFGCDWGAHPSTTQHLASALPAEDTLVWVDSLTMRSIRLKASEIITVTRRLRTRLLSRRAAVAASHRIPDVRLSPTIVPLHWLRAVRVFNQAQLSRSLGGALRRLDAQAPFVVVTNPLAVHFLDVMSPRAVAYLRLDDYALLPGVDRGLIEEAEPAMIARADVVVATARALLPPGARRTLYLSQGVDLAHFARVPIEPPRRRVLGFFGILAEWIDDDLVEQAAHRLPKWTFEFVGPIRGQPRFLDAAPNIVWRGPLPYEDLPAAMANWDAAWIPFRVDDLTRAVNPLKLREYLASGIPTFSTPLPESMALGTVICVGSDSDDVVHFLEEVVAQDSTDARLTRRAAVAEHGWSTKAAELIRALAGSPGTECASH
jgi:hypothetical protein